MPGSYSWVLTDGGSSTSPQTPALTGGEDIARNLALSDDGDLLVEGGQLQLVRGIDAVRQAVACALQLWKGEYFLNVERGVDFIGRIFVKAPSLSVVRGELRKAIENVPAVLEVTSLELDFDAAERSLSVTFDASTDLGELVSETIEVGA